MTLSASFTALSAARAPSLFLLSMVTTGPIGSPLALSADATSCPVPSHKSDGADHHHQEENYSKNTDHLLAKNNKESCIYFIFSLRSYQFTEFFVMSYIVKHFIQKPPRPPPQTAPEMTATWAQRKNLSTVNRTLVGGVMGGKLGQSGARHPGAASPASQCSVNKVAALQRAGLKGPM